MNRLKLGAFGLLVLAAGAVNLHLVTQWLASAALAGADRTLAAAAGHLDAQSRLLAARASALADAAARAPAVLAALGQEGEGDPTAAAALAAGRGLPAAEAAALLLGTSGLEGAVLRVAGKRVEAQDPAGSLFAEALRGERREGYARVGDALWMVVAVPAGRGAVAAGLPVDQAWAEALKQASGTDVVIAAGQARPIGTLTAAEAAAAGGSALAALPRPIDAGAPPRLRTAISWLPLVPLQLARVPARRLQVVSLRGMRTGLVALSVPMAPLVSGIATYQVVSAAVLLLLLLSGFLVGVFIASDAPAAVPRELIQAADRIARGDFAARAPALGGSMATLASALNHAAEIAAGAAGRAGDSGADPFAPRPAAEAIRAGPDPFAPAPDPPEPRASPEPQPPRPAAAAEPARRDGEASEAFLLPLSEPPPARPARPPEPPAQEPTSPDLFAPAPQPRPERLTFTPLGNTVSGATLVSTRPEDLAQASAAPAMGEPAATPAPLALEEVVEAEPASADPEAAHWQEVFREFLRVRVACGEEVEVPWPRFEAKLRSNRTTLVEKHGCRTVRFQVYVKDGRAAIRATPVR